jgi:hypothetical protein
MMTITITKRDEVISIYRSKLADPSNRKKLLVKRDIDILAAGFIGQLSPLSDPVAIDSLTRQELSLLEEGLDGWEISNECLPVYIAYLRTALDDRSLSLPADRSIYPALRIILAYQQGDSIDSIPSESTAPVDSLSLVQLSRQDLFDRIVEVSNELRQLQHLASMRSGLYPNSGFQAPLSSRPIKSKNVWRKCQITAESIMDWNKSVDLSRRFRINVNLLHQVAALNLDFTAKFIAGYSESIDKHHSDYKISDRSVTDKQFTPTNRRHRNPDYELLVQHCRVRLEFMGHFFV